ncbi:hypothetical protein BDV25DRAFT_98948 [Aspergillus avenaceus]|uniref:Uncharacterized protein n=1 Tax=Aspergillus avenaceus TaxID=36643 RepID=A0A5N6TDM6_ASPAV|nr:hypothetical protein BDV25DRAFT_98948 [Aspergillus avenaceus]
MRCVQHCIQGFILLPSIIGASRTVNDLVTSAVSGTSNKNQWRVVVKSHLCLPLSSSYYFSSLSFLSLHFSPVALCFCKTVPG